MHIENFKSDFKQVASISINDIVSFYRKFDDKVKKTMVKWRIYTLVDKGVIQRIGRGKYKLGKQKEFAPFISDENESLYLKLKDEYPFLEICIWSTQWLIQWMLHIPGTYETIIEVEKGAEENAFYFLSETYNNVFINPQKDILNKYAKSNEPVIIIKNLVTDSPLQKIGKVQIPTIEKIIVDLIADRELYSTYQGRDLDSIIENAFEYNTINEDKLFRYANRRKKEPIVYQLINKAKTNDIT